MRIMVRTFSFTVMGLCICLMLMHCLDLTIRLDEVDRISKLAMDNTQIVVMENIEDYYYKTDNARNKISTSNDCLNIYLDNLNTLKSSDGNYSVSGYFDPLKGLIYANINYSYTNFLGEEKIINKKLLNIIDVVKYEETS